MSTFYVWVETYLSKAFQCIAINVRVLVLFEANIVPRQHWDSVIINIVNIHMSVEDASAEFRIQLRRENYVTVTNYISFISGFKKLLRDKTE